MSESVPNYVAMYSIYDEDANAYNPPFFYSEEALAIRAFMDILADTGSVFRNHPESFSLRLVGYWNPHDGEVESAGGLICTAVQALQWRALREKRVQQQLELEINEVGNGSQLREGSERRDTSV